jgi:hypothetical protein
MNPELMELRARIAALERALVIATDRRRAWSAACAVTLAAVLVALFFVALPISINASGPTTVTAPFTVVDGSGQLVMKVDSLAGRGAVVSLYNGAARGVVELGGSPSGCCGTVRVYDGSDNAKPRAMLGVNASDTGGVELAGVEGGVTQLSGKGLVVANGDKKPIVVLRQVTDHGYLDLRDDSGTPTASLWSSKDGGGFEIDGGTGSRAATIEAAGGPGKLTIYGGAAAKATIGVSADDAGLVRLASAKGNAVMLHGVGAMKTLNPAGQEVVDIGADPHGNGIVDVRHSTGVGGVRLDVSETGAGNVKIHTPPFEIMAQIGLKEGGRGDVCVMGRKGLICLSGVAAKSLIPW